MDLDTCGNSDFYDEIASFTLPPSGDYSLDDIDEILRSTDSTIDLANFATHNVHDFEMPPQDSLQDDFNFGMPPLFSSAVANPTVDTSPYGTQRTSSTSSMEDEPFNLDEFINFSHEDDIKMEELTQDTVNNMQQQRNTPSPTGSCSSSSGSSTSGVQSDASSVSSDMKQQFVKQEIESDIYSNENSNETIVEIPKPLMESAFVAPSPAVPVATTVGLAPQTMLGSSTVTAANRTLATVSVPVPVLPIQSTTTTATIIQPLPQVQPINVLQGTLIPVKTVPLTNVTPVASIKAPTPIKIEPKLAPKTVAAQPVKIIPPSAPAAAAGAVATPAKITPPPNAKPKTIFLSSNDFKALMQKMNTNGKGAKISGGLNGQIPKIIMKTANGKVITTTNKIVQPLNANNVQQQQQQQQHSSTQFVPKIVKTSSAPLVIKQQQGKVGSTSTNVAAAAAAAAAAARAVVSSNGGSNMSIYKGLIDEKILKKQQRMIKNRESASLSRKKKKEYVASLESRISNLEKENYTLKGENSTLRSQLVALAQTCNCKNSNISEFVLNSLNISTKGGSEHHHVKIAPKPAPKSMRQRMLATNVKKNVAVLFAMAFMVTMNVGNFQSYLNKNPIENSIEAGVVAEPEAVATAGGGRHLLWVETENEFKQKLNRTKRETELEVPPLHFLQPVVNRTTRGEMLGNHTADEPPSLAKCNGNCAGSGSGSLNHTENLRLASSLHKWIDGNDYLNLSLHEKFGNDLDKPMRLKLNSDYLNVHEIDLPLQKGTGTGTGTGSGPSGQQKRKFYVQESDYDSKQRKLDAMNSRDRNGNGNGNGNIDDNGNGHGNSLDIFKPKISDEYLRLFKGIKRQDDTFYVLSFNMDHILLPASAYNKSSRPKMSLMLPAGDPSLNGDIVLMQIDCEVVNTTELEIKSDMIPEKLRPSHNKYGNVNLRPTPNANDVANNETGSETKPGRSMPQKPHTAAAAEDEEEDMARSKPVAKTYYVVSPKSQTVAKKPTIIKLSNNVNFIGQRAAQIKNSTLFAKMRDTVQGDFKYN